MYLHIFDVSHGFCAYLIADNLNVMLFDCGYNEKTGFKPTNYLRRNGCTGIEYLIIQNYDQDHISDLQNLSCSLPINTLIRNLSVTPKILKSSKEKIGPITNSMEVMLEMASIYTDFSQPKPILEGITFEVFYNKFPIFTDMNNLSVVTFVFYDDLGIIFPGDLEKPGWLELLRDNSFCSNLKRTNIFIASHHGRESGYCQEVFNYCHPEIVIISDKEMIHETQKNCYAQHASGVVWDGGPQKRYVLTTRADGDIKIRKEFGNGFHIFI